MQQVKLPKPKMTLYGLVRDSNGRPKVNDPAALHPAQIALLTPAEREELGVTLQE